MRIHFFTAPFYYAFIWFKVQGSRFRVQVAASPPFLEDSILITSERIHAYVEKRIPTDKAFPAWGRWRAERAG